MRHVRNSFGFARRLCPLTQLFPYPIGFVLHKHNILWYNTYHNTIYRDQESKHTWKRSKNAFGAKAEI